MAVIDTTTLLDLFRAKPSKWSPLAWTTATGLIGAGAALHTTRFNILELYVGEALSDRPEREAEMIRKMMGVLQVLEFDDRAARLFAAADAALRKSGQRVDDMDLLIASVALAHNMPVVTRNHKHFDRIPGLRVIGYP